MSRASGNDWSRTSLRHARPQESVVTQQELQRLRQLQQQIGEYNALRSLVLEKLGNGAPIQRGPLNIHVHEKERCQFSRGKLEAVLGVEYVADLMMRIEPTICQVLTIVETGGGHGPLEI